MADAAWEQTMTQIRTNLLARIDGTGNYAYDLRAVYRDQVALATIRANTPCVVMAELDDNLVAETTAGDYVDRAVAFLAYLTNDVASGVTAAQQLNNMQADLYRALVSGGNQYHNGTAILVRFEGADRLYVKDAPVIAIEARFKVRYAFSRAEPTEFHA